MPTGQLLIVDSNAEVVRQGLQDLGADIPKVGRLGIFRTVQRIMKRLKAQGRPVTRPIRWDSPKQKRAFFATDGFGAGIPTGRSGETEGAWEAVPLPNGYEISNDSRGALFVYGDEFGHSQSMIHKGDWPLQADVVKEEVARLPEDVQEELRTAIVAHGFAPGT